MRVAILGGGMTGLTAAYYLSQKSDNTVVVYEAESGLGGLASGFRGEGWDWTLERAYHHIFSSDKFIINFLREVGYPGVIFSKPTTASLYEREDEYRVFAVDTPFELLRFPLLSFAEKIRSGAVLGAFKVSPYLSYFDKHSTEELSKKWMGKNAYETLFGEIFRKKFGKYAENILASFIWSRIHMRTKTLGYMEGGFQTMIDHIALRCEEQGVNIEKSTKVTDITKNKDNIFVLTIEKQGKTNQETFDFVVSTLPSPILATVAGQILTTTEISKLQKLKYLSANNLILETDSKVFEKEYWVSLCTPKIPSLVFLQHTNFMNSNHYNNHHLLYIGSYGEPDDKLMTMNKEELLALYLPTIQKIAGKKLTIHNSFLWKARHAQPIFDLTFLENVPHFHTSDPRFFIANLDMTYPYDRGTNYAVKLGKEVSSLVLNAAGV